MDDYGRFAHVTVAKNGTLVYAQGRQAVRRLSWVSHKGKVESLEVPAQLYSDPRLSPSGRQIAVMIGNYHERRLWIYDLERRIFEQITFEGSVNRAPVWSPDSTMLAYESNQGGQYNIFLKTLRSDISSKQMNKSPEVCVPYSWSRDGKKIAFVEFIHGNPNIWLLDTRGDKDPVPFLVTPKSESQPVFSPSGKLLAYVSDEDGTPAVYARLLERKERKWKISKGDGHNPVWAPDGSEIYYSSLDGTKLFSVRVLDSPFSFGEEVLLFEGLRLPFSGTVGAVWSYDISPDGSRFLMVSETEESEETRLVVITNWLEDLKRKVSEEK
jgi:Tol biopolymer transport system component